MYEFVKDHVNKKAGDIHSLSPTIGAKLESEGIVKRVGEVKHVVKGAEYFEFLKDYQNKKKGSKHRLSNVTGGILVAKGIAKRVNVVQVPSPENSEEVKEEKAPKGGTKGVNKAPNNKDGAKGVQTNK